jgi:hypothetical protein
MNSVLSTKGIAKESTEIIFIVILLYECIEDEWRRIGALGLMPSRIL